MDRSGPPTPYPTPSEPVSTLSAQPSAAEPPPDFAFRFPCSAYSECWPFVAVQRDGRNGLDRADILLLGKDEAGENISMRTEPLSLKLKRTALTSAEPCRRPEGWHPRCSHHAKRGDALELGRAVDRVAQRERSNGLDQADILLLAKDEAGENVLHAACTYGNINIIAFECGLNDFALKPGALLSIMNARNHKGDTPVHNATQNNQIDCLTALLQRGADLTPS